MKKEQLLEIGLTEEQATSVFALNGKSITDLQEKVETLKGSLKAKEEALKEAQQKTEAHKQRLTELEGLNADELRQQVQDWENKYNTDLESLKLDHALDMELTKQGAKNAKLVKGALDLAGLKLKEGQVNGLEEQLAKLKETDGYLFAEAEKTPPPVLVTATTTQPLSNNKELKKMGYSERLEFKKNSPKQYEQLKGESE